MALKIGTENKTKTYAAIGLGVFVLLYGAYVLHDQFSSPAPVTVPLQRRCGCQPPPPVRPATTALPRDCPRPRLLTRQRCCRAVLRSIRRCIQN